MKEKYISSSLNILLWFRQAIVISLFFFSYGYSLAAGQNAERVWTSDQILRAYDLAAQSALLRGKSWDHLSRRLLLSAESLNRYQTPLAFVVWAEAMNLYPSLVGVFKHEDAVRTVVFSPDEKWLATASMDRSARLWSLENGQELVSFEHEGKVIRAYFSPNSRWLATVSLDNKVSVWDVILKQKRFERMNDKGVGALAFSPDSTWLAIGGWDHSLRIWQIPAGYEVFSTVHEGGVSALTFSGDGRLLATVCATYVDTLQFQLAQGEEKLVTTVGTVYVFDTDTWRETMRLNFADTPTTIAFSYDGSKLACGGLKGEALVWDTATGQEIARINNGDAVSWLAFSPSNKWFATSGFEMRVWDADSFTKILQTPLKLRLGSANWAIGTDGDRLAIAGKSATSIVHVPSGKELARLPPTGGHNTLAFNKTGELVATSSNNSALVWRVDAQGRVAEKNFERAVDEIRLSPDGTLMAVVERMPYVAEIRLSPDGTLMYDEGPRSGRVIISIWDFLTGKKLFQAYHNHFDARLAFTANGQLLATTVTKNTVQIWKSRSGEKIGKIQSEDEILDLTFNQDGSILATASRDKTARTWRVAATKEMARVVHEGMVETVAFSPDGRMVASGSQNGVRLWDPRNGQEMFFVQHDGFHRELLFSADGHLLATKRWNDILIWNVKNGKLITRISPQQEYPLMSGILGLVFSPDSKLIASASWSSQAWVWDARTGKQVLEISQEGGVSSVAFSPDSSSLITGSYHSAAHVWDLMSGREILHIVDDEGFHTVGFVPGSELLMAGSKKIVRFLPWRAHDIVRATCERALGTLTRAQWKLYMRDELYQPICPELIVAPEEPRLNPRDIDKFFEENIGQSENPK